MNVTLVSIDTLGKWRNSLKNCNLPKLTKEGMEYLNSPITIKDLKSVDRTLPYKENLRSRWPHWCFLLNIQGTDHSNTIQTL